MAPPGSAAPPPLPTGHRLEGPRASGRSSVASVELNVRCGGSVHEKALEVARGEDGLRWGTSYGPAIMWTTSELLWGHVFAPQGSGLVRLDASDTLVDLGCGTGDILLAAKAACPECRVIGVDLDEKSVAEARRRAEEAQASAHAGITPIQVELGTIDACFEQSPSGELPLLAGATVVFIFLAQWATLRLRPRLLEVLPAGTRIVTRQFLLALDPVEWEPDAQCLGGDGRAIFRLYTVTAERKKDPNLQGAVDLERHFGLLWSLKGEGSEGEGAVVSAEPECS